MMLLDFGISMRPSDWCRGNLNKVMPGCPQTWCERWFVIPMKTYEDYRYKPHSSTQQLLDLLAPTWLTMGHHLEAPSTLRKVNQKQFSFRGIIFTVANLRKKKHKSPEMKVQGAIFRQKLLEIGEHRLRPYVGCLQFRYLKCPLRNKYQTIH